VTRTDAPPLAALLFDFGGTLDSDGIPWKTRFFRLWSEEIGEVEPARFDRAFYDADDALVGNLPGHLSLRETVRRLATGIAKGLSSKNGRASEVIVSRFCEDAFEHLSASALLLESLASRYRLAIVSNFYGNLPAVCAEAVDGVTHVRHDGDERVFGHRVPIDDEPLGEADEVRRRVARRSVARRAQRRVDHRRHRSLAVGAGDVHRAERPLGMAEPRHQHRDVVEADLDPQLLQAEEVGEGIHQMADGRVLMADD